MRLTKKLFGVAAIIAVIAFLALPLTGCPTDNDGNTVATYTAAVDDAANTTAINLTFSKAVSSLVAIEITVADGTGSVTRKAVSGSGRNWSFGVTVITAGTVTLSIARRGIESGSKTLTVGKGGPTAVTLNSVTANGSASQTTTQLTLAFSQEITGLSAADIFLDGVSNVTKETLSGSGATYTLPISGFTAGGTLTVAVAKSGYTISGSPKTVDIFYFPAVTLKSVTANGSVSQTTTQLTLVFSQAITGLSAADIFLDGVSNVTKGTLGGSGATYTLPISGFTAGGTLSVAVANSGYTISGSPRSVSIYFFTLGVEMVTIPAGTFTMGSPEDEPNSFVIETQHSVTLSGFKMGKYLVTQEQYRTVMGSNPSYFILIVTGESGTPGKLPVENVTWYDAAEFCNKLSVKEGLEGVYTISGRKPASGYPITDATVTADFTKNGYRLPTEAQWEYACRAGTTTAYNTGATISDNTGWYSANSGNKPHKVGLKPANAWGLYDMPGNVWEWCWDWYGGDYLSVEQTDPLGASSGDGRMVRGGGWSSTLVGDLRSANRNYSSPGGKGGDLGFRLVRP